MTMTVTQQRQRRIETVRKGTYPLGIIEWREPTMGTYPYHVTISTISGPQYLGVCATLAEARRAVRDNT